MPSPIRRRRTDAWYDVEGHTRVWTGRSYLLPAVAQVMRDAGELPTVVVTGPIQRKDGTVGTGKGRAMFGRFGTPIEQAPSWVQHLVIRFRAMEAADATA